jgi:hypothetical protein
MLDLVILMMLAAATDPSVNAGSTKYLNDEEPDAGNNLNLTENTRISIIPSQKTGIETPNNEMAVATLSTIEYCFVADNIPPPMPIITAISVLKAASFTVLGKRSIFPSLLVFS